MTARVRNHGVGAEPLGWPPLLGTATIFINDHVRVIYPSRLIGKLSDVAVPLYFPFLLSTGFALGMGTSW